MTGRRLWSRRETLLALSALGLSACAGGVPNRDVALGDGSSFRMLNWSDYIDPDDGGLEGTLTRLRRDRGIDVDYDESYEDNSVGQALFSSEIVPYDVVVPSNWLAAQLIADGLVEPLPIEVIPNHANIDPLFLTNAWDRGCRLQMPWQSGITGIAYDEALTGRAITSIADLFDPAFRGRVGCIIEMREAVGLGMLLNGDDPSRPTVATADAGLARIRDAVEAGQFGAFTAGDFTSRIDSGELWLAMAWSGDTFLLQQGLKEDSPPRPDVQFVIPDEGAVQWFDTMVIPKGAANLGAIGQFMDYVYDPVNAAAITAWVGYVSPVLGTADQLRADGLPELADNPLLFPDNDTRNRLFTWGGLTAADEARLDDEFNALVF